MSDKPLGQQLRELLREEAVPLDTSHIPPQLPHVETIAAVVTRNRLPDTLHMRAREAAGAGRVVSITRAKGRAYAQIVMPDGTPKTRRVA